MSGPGMVSLIDWLEPEDVPPSCRQNPRHQRARFVVRIAHHELALCQGCTEQLSFDAAVALREGDGKCRACGSDEPIGLTCPVCGRGPNPGFKD